MRSLAIISVLTFFSPLAVHADEWEYLKSDLDLLQNTLNESDSSFWEGENSLATNSTELFPDVGEAAQTSGRYVTVLVNGLTIEFTDVPRIQWFADYVQNIATSGIVSGYRDAAGTPLGLFGPSDSVTMEQLAKIAVQAAGISVETCGAGVPKHSSVVGTWSELYVRCAEYRGWSPYLAASDSMSRNATRGEVVQTLEQAIYGMVPYQPTGTRFLDVSLQHPYVAAIEYAAKFGFVSGYEDANGRATGIFGPNTPVNRAEIAKIVSKMLAG